MLRIGKGKKGKTGTGLLSVEGKKKSVGKTRKKGIGLINYAQ